MDKVELAMIGVGKNYVKRFLRTGSNDKKTDDESSKAQEEPEDLYPSPWLDENAQWQACLKNNQFTGAIPSEWNNLLNGNLNLL